MCFEEGQALKIKLPFADGGIPNYPRPFLIIEVKPDLVKMLNISSTKGKELKLMSAKNKLINDYNPPFYKPSFVKLDALYLVDKNKKLKDTHMADGDKLCSNELESIKECLEEYSDNNEFTKKRVNKNTFYKFN